MLHNTSPPGSPWPRLAGAAGACSLRYASAVHQKIALDETSYLVNLFSRHSVAVAPEGKGADSAKRWVRGSRRWAHAARWGGP